MQAENERPTSARAAETNARERLKGAVLDQGPVKTSNFMRHTGIFEDYEITNAKEMPFFMRVFAASALLHLVIFAVTMQLPMMVRTTCESTEFTQRLCDTIYVASLLSNSAGRDFVDQDYDPTQIPNAEDVTFINASDFTYPEGYWTLRDEIEGRSPDLAANQDPNFGSGDANGAIPGISTGSPSTLDLTKPPNLPGPNPGVVTGGEVNPPSFGTNPIPPLSRTARGPKGLNKNQSQSNTSPGNLPGLNANTNANDTAVQNTNKKPVSPLPEDAYNKKPLYDFRNKLVDWRETGQNNLYQPFQYALAATIDKDGKLVVDEKSIIFNGDPKMQDIVKAAVASFSDSGMLKALKDLQSKSVKIIFAQDGNQFNVRLETEQGTEKDARIIYNGINMAIEMGKLFVAHGVDQEPDPANKQKEQTTLELLKLAQLKREGNIVIIETAVPNKFAEDMYQTYKKDLEEKKSNPQGIAVNTNKNSAEVK